ncbi:MAG: hypothetical protein ABEJ92_08845 [Halobacteriales archaeon]
MLKRALLAGLLLAAGGPMLASAETAPLGVLLLAVGLSLLALPSSIRRTRAD